MREWFRAWNRYGLSCIDNLGTGKYFVDSVKKCIAPPNFLYRVIKTNDRYGKITKIVILEVLDPGDWIFYFLTIEKRKKKHEL